MDDSQIKTKQFKNVAVAVITNDNDEVLLVKPSLLSIDDDKSWHFPANIIIPGATYTEIFVSDILEKTGCIIEATSLISSEKINSSFCQYEYVQCKIICREDGVNSKDAKWVHKKKIKDQLINKLNQDLVEFFGL